MAALVIIGIYLLAFFLPILAKLLIHFDYVIVFVVTWVLVFGAAGSFEQGLLVNHDVHTVFTIIIYVAVLVLWYFLQQISIFGIYVIRIIGCALSALILTYLVSTGLLGQTIADGMDTIWMWTFGIVYFVIAVVLRAKNDGITNSG